MQDRAEAGGHIKTRRRQPASPVLHLLQRPSRDCAGSRCGFRRPRLCGAHLAEWPDRLGYHRAARSASLASMASSPLQRAWRGRMLCIRLDLNASTDRARLPNHNSGSIRAASSIEFTSVKRTISGPCKAVYVRADADDLHERRLGRGQGARRGRRRDAGEALREIAGHRRRHRRDSGQAVRRL